MSVINTNYLALVSQNNLTKSQNALGSAIERLSSGLRINSAKDDAAGQAIANRFTANIKGLTQAQRNANDGISIAQTTEGALNEINNNLQRIRELSVQAANGTNSSSDLQSIQDEIGQRLAEINRVSEQTQFNGVDVLAKTRTLNIQVGANDDQTIGIGLQKVDSTSLGLTNFTVNKVNLSEAITTDEDGDTITVTGGTLHEVMDDNGTGTGVYVIKDTDGKLFAAADGDDSEADFDRSAAMNAIIKTVDDTADTPNKLNIRFANDGTEVVELKNSNGEQVFVAAADVDGDTSVGTEVDALPVFKGEITSGSPLDDLDTAL